MRKTFEATAVGFPMAPSDHLRPLYERMRRDLEDLNDRMPVALMREAPEIFDPLAHFWGSTYAPEYLDRLMIVPSPSTADVGRSFSLAALGELMLLRRLHDERYPGAAVRHEQVLVP